MWLSWVFNAAHGLSLVAESWNYSLVALQHVESSRLLFSCSIVSDSLWPHGLHHAREGPMLTLGWMRVLAAWQDEDSVDCCQEPKLLSKVTWVQFFTLSPSSYFSHINEVAWASVFLSVKWGQWCLPCRGSHENWPSSADLELVLFDPQNTPPYLYPFQEPTPLFWGLRSVESLERRLCFHTWKAKGRLGKALPLLAVTSQAECWQKEQWSEVWV